ncbi:hypothetical protein ACFWN7_04745 [Agromyces sp. NPDC058484]|uniref:hypothetical protein n=1 Tax=Agromyces sp. NPDC058484 TaxID=3346524 RepID=UPI00365981E4
MRRRAPAAGGPIIISDRSWSRIGSGLTLVAVAALVAVALGEVDRLIASVPGSDNRSHSLNVVLSPLALSKTDSWSAWAGASLHRELGSWIITSALLDAVMVVALFALLWRLVHMVDRAHRGVPTVVLLVYAAAEFGEDVWQILGGWAVSAGEAPVAGWIGWVMAVFTTVKCLALVVFFIAVLRIGAYRHTVAHRIARIGQALWVHRLATLAILVIVVLSCIPAADLLDQLPDVQRQWADGNGWHLFWAVVVLLATAIATFVLGRRRTRFMVETRAFGMRRRVDNSRWQAAAPWILAPAVLVGALVIATALTLRFGGRSGIHWPTLITMLIITAAVPILAAAGYGWVRAHPKPPAPLDPGRARASWIVGDSLAVLVLVAGAIGIVRSYVVPFALKTESGDMNAATWFLVLIVGVAVAVFAPWRLLPKIGPRNWGPLNPNAKISAVAGDIPEAKTPLTAKNREYENSRVSRADVVEWWTLGIALAFLTCAMLFPSQFAGVFGGVAVTLLAIGAWVTVFGSFTLIVQSRQLIAPFRWLRLRAAPVLTLGILLPFAINVIVSSAAPDQTLHAVQVSNTGPAQAIEGDPLDERLRAMQRDWCTITTKGGVKVRPVYLIAAEGGGIRAAYWTASALATFGRCAVRSGFVSSGISGGSVGLAVASTVDDAPHDAWIARDYKNPVDIVERTKATAGPDVVSTAVLALAVGDAFAAGTGIRMPSYLDAANHADDSGWRWRDRAALVEALWERAAPGLSTAFSDEIDPLTGMLMLSSTDVVSRCRLLVDQAPILASPDESSAAISAADSGARSTTVGGPCDSVGGLPSMLGFRELPASGGSDPTTDCLASLDWSTAAMLSARFAIITPTGGLPAGPPCNGEDVAQFVDGGYVEPTSLAALADTAPRLMAMIADRNADRQDHQAWLMPMLIYLRNTQGYDLADDVARAESEPLVPITGGAARGNLTAEDAWIQRITLSMPAACPDSAAAAECRDALDELIRAGGMLPGGTVVIAPSSTPAVVPPLGWALSNMSEARFTSAIKVAAGCGRESEARQDQSATTRSGRYSGLAEFAELIGFHPCPAVAAQERARPDSG